MQRLAAGLAFAAVVVFAIPFAQAAQPRPTTRVIPCDTVCKHQGCTDKGLEHAKVVCGSAPSANMSQCIARNQRKYINECMRAPLGAD